MSELTEDRTGTRSGRRARATGRVRPEVLVAVAVGGALGTVGRYEIARVWPSRAGGMPWATLAMNVTGSALLGFLLTLVLERWPPTRFVRPFVAIGFLGAFTTFSTLAVESNLLVKDGHVATALMYDIASLSTGIVAAFIGIVLARARRMPGRRLR